MSGYKWTLMHLERWHNIRHQEMFFFCWVEKSANRTQLCSTHELLSWIYVAYTSEEHTTIIYTSYRADFSWSVSRFWVIDATWTCSCVQWCIHLHVAWLELVDWLVLQILDDLPMSLFTRAYNNRLFRFLKDTLFYNGIVLLCHSKLLLNWNLSTLGTLTMNLLSSWYLYYR